MKTARAIAGHVREILQSLHFAYVWGSIFAAAARSKR
jgi:hypothetical protein